MSTQAIHTPTSRGFTIVELLIVVVVISILTAITIVAYNGITNRAKTAALQSALNQAVKKINLYAIENGDNYPATASDAGLFDTADVSYAYEKNNAASPKAYCITTTSSSMSYFSTSAAKTASPGTCIGLVGWWPMNGGLSDQSGYNNNGTLNGTTLASGQSGATNSAYSFNGTSSDYITVPNFNQSVLNPSSFGASWTLTIWAKWGGLFTNEGVLIGKQGCNSGIYEYAGKYAFSIKGSGCWTGSQTIYGSTLDTSWHSLVATYQAGAMSFYQDGALQGTATLANMSGYGDTLGIGSGGYASYTFNGLLDDARVYTRGLSASEISNLHTAGAQ